MKAAIDIEGLLTAYQFNLEYAGHLVAGVSEELMYRPFRDGLENHPGFTLGHLSIASAMTVEYLGGSYDVPADWDEFFRRTGPGDPRRPMEYQENLPSKETLLAELARLHAEVAHRVEAVPENDWHQPAQWRLNRYYPTLSGLVSFMCITHEAMHLGQVAAWRRAAGLDSALAKL